MDYKAEATEIFRKVYQREPSDEGALLVSLMAQGLEDMENALLWGDGTISNPVGLLRSTVEVHPHRNDHIIGL